MSMGVIYWTNYCSWIRGHESMRTLHWIMISSGVIRCRAIWPKCYHITCKACLNILHRKDDPDNGHINKWIRIKYRIAHKITVMSIAYTEHGRVHTNYLMCIQNVGRAVSFFVRLFLVYFDCVEWNDFKTIRKTAKTHSSQLSEWKSRLYQLIQNYHFNFNSCWKKNEKIVKGQYKSRDRISIAILSIFSFRQIVFLTWVDIIFMQFYI